MSEKTELESNMVYIIDSMTREQKIEFLKTYNAHSNVDSLNPERIDEIEIVLSVNGSWILGPKASVASVESITGLEFNECIVTATETDSAKLNPEFLDKQAVYVIGKLSEMNRKDFCKAVGVDYQTYVHISHVISEPMFEYDYDKWDIIHPSLVSETKEIIHLKEDAYDTEGTATIPGDSNLIMKTLMEIVNDEYDDSEMMAFMSKKRLKFDAAQAERQEFDLLMSEIATVTEKIKNHLDKYKNKHNN